MRRYLILLSGLILLCVGCASSNKSNTNVSTNSATVNSNQAQSPNTSTSPKFSSAYTDLTADCKGAVSEKELTEGSDMPMKCKGFGGYHLTINYSAFAAQVSVVMDNNEDYFVPLPAQAIGYDQEHRKIEWRLADDKPFAVIARVSEYREDPEAGTNPYQERFKTGESLVVKGLKGFEHIDFTVDVKDGDANAKARDMADSAYARR